MAYAVDDAIAQVLTRLAEAGGSQVAELPADGGPAVSPDLTTQEQILIFLNEGQDELTRAGILQVYNTGAKSAIAIGTTKLLFTELTMTIAGQRMYQPRQAKWLPAAVGSTASPLQICARQWYEVHHPAIFTEATAVPERIYQETDGVLLGPIPAALGTLTLAGVVYPRPGASGDDFEDLPADLAPRLIAYGCAAVARQNAAEEALGAMLPLWEAEWRGQMAGGKKRRG